MPVHDWTLVDAGIFHGFHTTWIAEINARLNGGLLPNGFYCLPEQHTGHGIADVLTLHTDPESAPIGRPDSGGLAIAEAPPKVRRHHTLGNTVASRQRSLAIRHISGHRLIALLEIVSPANKDRRSSIEDFAAKAFDALQHGVHVLMVDLLPPGKLDPQGMHALIGRRFAPSDAEYDLPSGEPLTLASYAASTPVDAYIEHFAVGAALPDMPLFLSSNRYINVPLESTYLQAYRGMPAFWREVIEGRRTA